MTDDFVVLFAALCFVFALLGVEFSDPKPPTRKGRDADR